MKSILAAFAAFTILTGAAFAGQGCGGCGGAAKTAAVKCPVSKETVKSVASAPKSTYKGKTYYFASAANKAKFDKTPAKYAAKPSTKS